MSSDLIEHLNKLKILQNVDLVAPLTFQWFLTTPEIKFFVENGAVVCKLLVGAYGVDAFDFSFPEYMCPKIELYGLLSRPFARWTGLTLCQNKEKTFELKLKDDNSLATLEQFKNANIVKLADRHFKITVPFAEKQRKVLYHVGAFIIAYQRIHMLTQLKHLAPSDVLKVVTDAVFLKRLDESAIQPTFRMKQSPYTPCSEQLCYVSRIDQSFEPPAAFREPHKYELHSGMGGSGKTHFNLNDHGFVNCVYITPANRLVSDKKNENAARSHVLRFYNLHQAINNTISPLPNTIVLDEISMMTGH